MSRQTAVFRIDCSRTGTSSLLSYLAFVDLDHSLQGRTVRINHGLTEPVQQEPSALVRTNAELRLKLQRRDAVRIRRDEMSSKEPSAERQTRSVHDGSRRYRNLLMALGALPMVGLGFQPPALLTLTMRTAKAVWLPLLRQILSAGGVVKKHRQELLQRWRLVLGPTGGLFERCAHSLTMPGQALGKPLKPLDIVKPDGKG